MAKEYAVKTAVLSCQYGSKTSELKIPDHRHIFADGKGLGNNSDITPGCLGCFGTCFNPGQDLSKEEVDKDLIHVQELRGLIQAKPCQAEVEIPWQNPQPDVYAAHCNALVEGCWTVCKKGFGIISIISSGQSPGANVQKIIERIKELEEETESFIEANGIKPSEKEKLIESILLWNAYGKTGNVWNRISDEQVRAFDSYLQKENPALYNFFERDIIISDQNGEEVDLNYFIGMTKITVKDNSSIFMYYNHAHAGNQAMLNAYLDAANLRTYHYEEMKNASWSDIISDLYGSKGGTKTQGRYQRFINTYLD